MLVDADLNESACAGGHIGDGCTIGHVEFDGSQANDGS